MLEWNNGNNIERKTLFVEVILPLAITKTYTYRVPANFNEQITIGKRVIVQFGKSRIYTAIICKITENPPVLYEAKYILDVIDDRPIVNPLQLRLWDWIATYYLCYLGDIMQAALPAALKLTSETKVILLPPANYSKQDLNDKEFMIIDALEIHPELTVSDISRLLGQKTVFPILKSLFDKGIIHISEELRDRYKPRRKAYIKLNPIYQEAEQKKALFEVLTRAPRQLDVLLAYYKLSREYPEVLKSQLITESDSGKVAIKSLIDKGIFIQEDKVVSRLLVENTLLPKDFELTDPQNTALNSINTQFQEKEVVLLHGVTSSGKTQLYIRLIEQVLSKGKEALYLLPEIALTTQIIERLRAYFGSKIGVYHSKFSDNERVEVWNKVLNKEYQVVLGARSAVFLPFTDLGLIIVDEEHENSYKQFDPAPRYHARDTAMYLAHIHQAKVLLGSATPSLESYFNANHGKYGLAVLKERFGQVQLPDIQVVSLEDEIKRKTIQSHFTSVLMEAIKTALSQKEQVILFQNRRGYTPFLLCRTCGFSSKCMHCDVSLTYHKSTEKLHCHYCGYKQDMMVLCPACGSAHIEQKGYGTEKIEDELMQLLPDAVIARMDLDTTRSKNSFQRILGDFEDRKIDILVGTQMLAKGLDFDHVTVVGIINADSLLHYPDFRAFERGFQLLSQVSGRAGRREKPGKVIIQTYDTRHRVLDQVIRYDYQNLYAMETADRKRFHYPPFYRLIQVDIKHKDARQLHQIADRLAGILRPLLGQRILGPETPIISRVRNYYIKTMMIKMERDGDSVHKIKYILREKINLFEADKANKGVRITIDVDPF